MEKPIRYYITKSGEEPTVRTVTVARGSQELDDRSDSSANPPVDATTPALEPQPPTGAVRRLMKGALRRQPPRV